jgi:hypothetical protein
MKVFKLVIAIVLLNLGLSNVSAQSTAPIPDSNPVAVQLKAYNERDIETFVSAYSDTVKVYFFPGELQYQGKSEMRQKYAAMFERTPDLHCELVNRMVMGNIIIDQEKVLYKKGQPRIDAIAIYKLKDNLIYEVTFLKADK